MMLISRYFGHDYQSINTNTWEKGDVFHTPLFLKYTSFSIIHGYQTTSPLFLLCCLKEWSHPSFNSPLMNAKILPRHYLPTHLYQTLEQLESYSCMLKLDNFFDNFDVSRNIHYNNVTLIKQYIHNNIHHFHGIKPLLTVIL